MTIIAWDGTTLSADKEAGTQYIKSTRTTKIHRLSNGWLVGIAGDSAVARELLEWIKAGAVPKNFPEECRPGKSHSAKALVITLDREILVYECGPYPIQFEGKFHAIGAGSDAALAVLYLGHNSILAVQVASQICNGCGGGIDTLELAS